MIFLSLHDGILEPAIAALRGFIIAYSGGFSLAFYLWDKVIF